MKKSSMKKISSMASVFAVSLAGLVGLSVMNAPGAVGEEKQLADIVYESQSASHSGNGVSDSCDVTGDGVEDLIVLRNWWKRARNDGAGYANYGKKGSQAVTGAAYVIPGGSYANGHLDDENSGVIRLEGPFSVDDGMKQRGHGTGVSEVSCIGDVNADGIDDIAIGDIWSKKMYVVYGSPSLHSMNLSYLGTSGFVIDGEGQGTFPGNKFVNVGDLTGDGKAEIAFYANDGWHIDDVSSTDGVATVKGADHELMTIVQKGFAFEKLDDFNGDGKADFIVGTGNDTKIILSPSKGTITPETASSVSITGLSALGNGSNSQQVVSVGDINGDGLTDFMMQFNVAKDDIKTGVVIILGAKNNENICISLSKETPIYECENPENSRGYVVTAPENNERAYNIDFWSDGIVSRAAFTGIDSKKFYAFDPTELGEDFTVSVADLPSTATYEYNGSGNANGSIELLGMQPSSIDETKQSLYLAFNATNDRTVRIMELANTQEPKTIKPVSVVDNSVHVDEVEEAPQAGFFDKKSFTVTFDVNGGKGSMDDVKVLEGDMLTLPENTLTRDTFTFSGWNTKADGTGTSYDDKAMIHEINEDVTLYAQWCPQWTGSQPQDITPSSVYERETTDAKLTWGFSEYAQEWKGQVDCGCDNVTYDDESHNFTFVNGKGYKEAESATTKIAWDGSIRLYPYGNMNYPGMNAAIKGMNFHLGNPVLEVEEDGSGILSFEVASTATSGMESELKRVTVASFDKGSIVMKEDAENETIHVTFAGIPNYAQNSYEYTARGGNDKVKSEGAFPAEFIDHVDSALRAYFYQSGASNDAKKQQLEVSGEFSYKKLAQYGVTLNPNDGSSDILKVDIQEGKSYPLNLAEKNLKREGYTFNGWNTSADGTGDAIPAASQYTPQGDVTLYAQWVLIPKENTIFERLWGAGSLDTAQSIVQKGFTNTGGTVVIATYNTYYDALTASGIAGFDKAPILTVSSNNLPAQTRQELQRLKPRRVIIIGGEKAITPAVSNEIHKVTGVRPVRYSGAVASDTADAIALAKDGHWADTGFVVTSRTFQDALSAAPLSYSLHMPIFLTNMQGTELSANTIYAMKHVGIKKVVIVGGQYAVSPAVEKQLTANGIDIETRLWGTYDVETSYAVAQYGLSKGMTANNMGVATATKYYDALAGAALNGVNNSVLVLSRENNVEWARRFVEENIGTINHGYVYGGQLAISDSSYHKITGE
ncbi:MAG: cell wall-binding repeat-containing protein [Actinomycetaceae bacterium]|nr:cell wall-binding repeat-containing protein [Actinomycetaceae bacterium]